MSTMIRTSDKAPNIDVEFQPSKAGAKMLPAIARAEAACCSRTGCTNPVSIGQAVRVHPVSGRVFHEVTACNGTLTKDLPKAPTQSAILAEAMAEIAKLREPPEAAQAERDALGAEIAETAAAARRGARRA